MTNHTLTKTRTGRGVTLYECDTCAYAVLVDPANVAERQVIDEGDTTAAHSLFVVPEMDLGLRVGASVDYG